MFKLSIALCFAAARSAIRANTALSLPPSSPFTISLSSLSLIGKGLCHTLSTLLPESTTASDFDVRGKILETAPKFTPASSRLADRAWTTVVGLPTSVEWAPTWPTWAGKTYPCPGGKDAEPLTSVKNGWARHSSAVARSSESNANIGTSQSVNPWAVSGSHSYFSVNTSYNPHGFSFVICRSSPILEES